MGDPKWAKCLFPVGQDETADGGLPCRPPEAYQWVILPWGEAQRSKGNPIPHGPPDGQNGLSQVPAQKAIPLEEGAQSFPRCRALLEGASLSLTPDTWTAHFSLFAQCLAFAQPFNSLHQLECKYQPAAKAASLGHHPTIRA